jgi:hypothetical protein
VYNNKNDDGRGDDGGGRGRGSKPKRYRDVVREQILEQMKEEEAAEGKGARVVENGDNNRGDDGNKNTDLAYDAKQREIRRAFLESTGYDDDAAGDDNGDGDVGNDRAKGIGGEDDDDDEDWIKPKAKDIHQLWR